MPHRHGARTLEELRFRFFDANGEPLEPDERMRQFALKYAQRFARQADGTLPYSSHPFPNPWEPTFYIDFGGPNGFESDEAERFQAEQSGAQA